MPTYEYRCPEGHEFELFQRMSDEPGADCPQCGKAAERLLSAGGGLLFKGDGFYITDYRSPEYKKKAQADAGGGSKESKSSGSDSASSSPSPSSSSD
ncbi:FmdB family zinc ribbon protein [Gaopeijia maritima]|uniref:FmdB family zinc ribbon protein n=1 Tax=Gaopeijia maritima TaxID=3119007 RepID=A0ABU9EAM1_9BACT